MAKSTKMKKLFVKNRNGTILFSSQAALKQYIESEVSKYSDKIRKENFNAIHESAFELSLLLSMEVLHLNFGFGDKRLSRFLERYKFNMDSLAEDYFEFGELKDEYAHLLNIEELKE